MKGTLPSAILVSVITSALTTWVLVSLRSGGEDEVEPGVQDDVAALRGDVDTAAKERRKLSSALNRLGPTVRAVEEPDAAPGPAESAAQDPRYVTKEDVEEMLQSWIAEKKLAAPTGKSKPGGKPQTLEDVAKELDLSLGETDGVRAVLRDVEEDAIELIYGDRPIEDVRNDLRAAEDDEDLQAELLQTTVTNWVGNLGKLMALQKDRFKRVVDVLGRERGERFVEQRVRSVNGAEFDDVIVKLFGGK